VLEVLRSVYKPKREEVAEGWRTLHNEALHNLYALENSISVIKARKISWAGHVACMLEMRNSYNIFVGKPEGRKPLKRLRRM
jgi:hypothetical protein